MDQETLKQEILNQLREAAPDADPDSLEADTPFRDQFEMDSVDFLNFVLGLEKRLGVSIPEYDYPQLASLEGARYYLTEKLG